MKRFRLPSDSGVMRWAGVVPAARALALADRILAADRPVTVVLCPGNAVANELRAVLPRLLTLAGQPLADRYQLATLPLAPDVLSTADDPLPERLREELECDRLAALTLLADTAQDAAPARRLILFATPAALFGGLPPRSQVADRQLHLRLGDRVDFAQLRARLAGEFDYDCEALCERPGQFAVRGGLLDVYPLNAEAPARLDFFGDEIESIRSFDPTTQRSIGKLDELVIAARRPAAASSEQERALFDYLGPAIAWVLIEPAELVNATPARFETYEQIVDQRATLASLYTARQWHPDSWITIEELETDPRCVEESAKVTVLPFESLEAYRTQPLEDLVGIDRLDDESSARRSFYDQLRAWHGGGRGHLLAVLPHQGKIAELQSLLSSDGYADLEPDWLEGELGEGFTLSQVPDGWLTWLPRPVGGRLTVVSEREWLGRHAARRPSPRSRLLPHRTSVDGLLDFADLADGDYLVHLSHGICRYRGIQRIPVRDRDEEVISVEFADRVTLHVPLADAHLLTRYVGLSRANPRLGKLGSGLWEKTRAAAEHATLDFAAEMLNLQAARTHGRGHAFAADTAWQKAFENAFPYKETTDQLRAIEDTKRDMESPKVMDRLLCGDVGFGKTEVAIRAAFKAIMDGFQVAIMVPTTILAQQHFDTFRQRFAPYPISVEMLSRFRQPHRQKEIVRQLAEGRIDLIIGTHRLISRDVHFARLGLLIIDEEHRFGVRHKEQLKRRRQEVDVLSMSATPIPRTLYLALMGARDLSVIETPPADRLPIETLVRSYDPELVRSAITRELDRGGQVFYLHNRVQTIDSVAAGLQRLVPRARIAVGHGQMSEDDLERIMVGFVAGKTDILVCTTIIENGLDIPNCNTIIIEGADRFGLSQLYQLRGRVGRFNRQAYAYLLLHRHARMLDLARQRLSAMRQHNQLGAGFRIAMRDLELRGAGNLLGHQQSGHIAGVGFDLYCQLLRQSIERLKGEASATRIRANVALDFIISGRNAEANQRASEVGIAAIVEEEIAESRLPPVAAELPADYIPEARLRIDFYRQLAIADSVAQVQAIGEAMTDRFGKAPAAVTRLLAVTRIRVRAEIAGIRTVETDGNRLKCQRASGRRGDFVQLAGRFPRLSGRTPAQRLKEIESFLCSLS